MQYHTEMKCVVPRARLPGFESQRVTSLLCDLGQVTQILCASVVLPENENNNSTHAIAPLKNCEVLTTSTQQTSAVIIIVVAAAVTCSLGLPCQPASPPQPGPLLQLTDLGSVSS